MNFKYIREKGKVKPKFNTLFAVQRLPLASTTLTRLFGKIKKLCDVEKMSDGLWRYLSKLIPWCKILEDWLTFDSSVLERYGKQEDGKRGYNPKKKGRGSHNPLFAFLNKSKYVVNLWNRPGNVASWNNILGFFESPWHRLNGLIKISGIIADSGFYLLEFIQMLEAKGLKYIIGTVRNLALISLKANQIYPFNDFSPSQNTHYLF